MAPVLVAAAVFGSALTLASFVKVIHSVFLGGRPVELAKKPPTEASSWMLWPMIILAVACVAFGVFAAAPLNKLVQPSLAWLRLRLVQTWRAWRL